MLKQLVQLKQSVQIVQLVQSVQLKQLVQLVQLKQFIQLVQLVQLKQFIQLEHRIKDCDSAIASASVNFLESHLLLFLSIQKLFPFSIFILLI